MSGSAAIAHEWTELDEDRTLVEAAQKSADAFAPIYTRYSTRIYLYVRARVATDEDALDITQQVFVKSFKALPKYRCTDTPVSAWLFRVARNLVIDHQRRTRSTTDINAIPGLLRSATISPEDAAVRGEEIELLRSALKRLDQEKRDLLALRYAANLRIREIAAVVGKSEEATKKQLSRALQSLRKQYDALA